MFPGSIRYIVLFIITLAILPALGLILYSGVVDRQAAVEQVYRSAEYQTGNIARQQRLVVESTRTFLVTLAQLKDIREFKTKEANSLFRNLLLRFTPCSNIRLCDLEGNVVSSAASSDERLNPEEMRVLKEVVATPVFTVQEFSFPENEGPDKSAPVLNCIYPVRNANRMVGVLIASVKIAVPAREVESFKNKGGLQLLITDHNGRVGFSSSSLDVAPFISAGELEGIRSSTADQGVFRSTYKGEDTLVTFERLRLNSFTPPYLDLLLVVSGNRVSDQVQGLLYRNIFLLFLVAIFAFGISWNFCRITLIAPIAKLLKTAKQIKEGDLSARVNLPKVAKEFEVLATSMNSMSSILETKGRELIDASNAALAASKAKSEFLATMSHEIRTPMNAILGMTYLALRTTLNERQHSYVSKIHSEATRLLAVINDILDFSKIEAGKLNIEHVPFDLKDTLSTIIGPARQAAARKEIYFRETLPEESGFLLLGDPFHLSQVLGTLLNNAVKYTKTGGVIFTCEEKIADGDNDNDVMLSFTVRDTGPGLTKEQIESFYPTEEKKQTTLTQGTGLSLVIARRLVSLMQGRISVDSIPGRGSTIYFDVPVKKAAPLQLRADGSTCDFTTVRTLVADPLKSSRDFMVSTLQNFSMSVSSVSTQEELINALAKAEEDNAPAALLIMDRSLLPHKGDSLARHIKTGMGLKRPPSILLIAQAGRQDLMSEGEKSGADIIIYRPFDASTLFNSVQEALLLSAPAPDAGKTSLPGTGNDIEELSLTGVRLLLVEDNPINQQIAVEILTANGASVDVAGNGAIALEKLENSENSTPYAAVLMDLQMPVMDGFETTKRIRQNERLALIPVIAMTAHTIADEWEQCMNAGMDDYIAKPIEVTKLFATLKKWLARKHR